MAATEGCRGSVRIRHAAGPSWFTARLRLGLEVQLHVRQRIAYKRPLGSDSADGSIVGEAAERSVIHSASDRRTHNNSQEGSYSVQQTVTKEHLSNVPVLYIQVRSHESAIMQASLREPSHVTDYSLGHYSCPVFIVPQQS